MKKLKILSKKRWSGRFQQFQPTSTLWDLTYNLSLKHYEEMYNSQAKCKNSKYTHNKKCEDKKYNNQR